MSRNDGRKFYSDGEEGAKAPGEKGERLITMTNTESKVFKGAEGSLGQYIRKALLLPALLLLTPLTPLFALFSGSPASVSLGQPVLTKGSPNAVTSAGLGLPQNVAIAPLSGRVYAADANNNRVLWWNAASFTTGHAADGVIGQADFTGSAPNQGGLAGAKTLSAPNGVAVDAVDNVWVADSGNNRVLKFSAPAANNASATLALGQPNLTSTAFNISATALSNPIGVAIDAGNVFVADSGNNRVLKYNTPAASGPAAVLVLGQINYISNAPAVSQARLNSPASVSVDASGNIWVADTGNNRVVEYASPGADGAPAALVLGQVGLTMGTPNRGTGIAANTMNSPSGVAVNGTNVWVADTNNSRILEFTAPFTTGQDAALLLGQANAGVGSTNRASGAAAATSLALPSGVAIDGLGNIWVADASNYRVMRYPALVAAGGPSDLVLGQKDALQYAVNMVLSSSIYGPSATAVDSTGRVYAADYNNNRVLWWTTITAFTNAQPAAGVLGQLNDFTSMLPNQGGLVGPGTLSGPFSVAVDGADNLWVNDMGNSRLLRFNSPVLSLSAPSIVLGQPDYVTAAVQGSPTALTLSGVSGISVDASGKLWVADSGNNRVLRFSTLVTAAPADFVVGQADYVSNAANRNAGSPPTVNTLNFPSGVSLDTAGNLWISDSSNSRVLKYPVTSLPAAPTAALGPNATLALGQPLFTTAASGNTQTTLNNPGGVMVAPAGTPIWVADSFNSRVLRYDAPAGNGAPASLVLGQADFTGSQANRGAAIPSAATLSYPNAVVTTPGKYWIADTGNNRLLQGDLALTTALSPAFTGISSTTLTASWNSVPTATYVVVFSSKSDFSPFISSAAQLSNTASFTGLNSSTSYYLEVKLSTEPDTAYFINQAVGQTSPAVTPLTPALTKISSGSLTASWTAIAGMNYSVALSALSNFSTIISSGTQFAATANFAGLSPATVYYFEVKLSTEGAASFAANTVSAQTLPVLATPLSPVASGVTTTGFTMNWTAAAGGASYVAVLSNDAGFTLPVRSSVTSAGNSQTYAGLSEYTNYYFEVKLSTESDSGYVPNRVTVRTLAAVGHTPLNPAFTVGSATTLAAVWASVPNSTYTVVFSSSSSFATIISSVAQTDNSASYSGLTPDTSYYLRVKLSTEAAGALVINTTIRKTSVGGAGAEFFITPNNSTDITVTWPYTAGEQRVLVLANDAAFTNIVSSFTTAPSEYTETYKWLSGGTSYYFEMKMKGEPNSSFIFNSAVIFMPAAQVFPYATAVANGSFTINWDAPAGYMAPNYTVKVSTDSGFGGTVLTATVPGLSKAFTGLTSDTQYYFAVKVAADAASSYLDIANTGFQRTLPTLLAPVLSTVSSSALSATWTTVPTATYVVVLATASDFTGIISSGTQAQNTAAFTGLTPYVTHYLEVKVVSETDNAYAFNTAAKRTLPGGVPLAPVLTAVSSGSVSAGWAVAAGSSYIVVLAADPNYAVVLSSTVETSSPTVYSGLASDTPYYLGVQLVTDPSYALFLNSVSTSTLPTPLRPALVSPAVEKLNASWKSVPGSHFSVVLALDRAFANVVASTVTESVTQNFTGLIGAMPYYLGVRMVTESTAAYSVNWSSAVVQAGALRLFSMTPNKVLRGVGLIPVTMTGVGMAPASTIRLTRNGFSDVVASSITWVDPAKMTFAIPRTLALGQWNVLVTGGGFTTALPNGLLMLTADPNTAKVFQGIFKPNQGEEAQLAIALVASGNVSIKIYDSMGRQVRTITDGFRAAGDYVDAWNGRNSGGSMCASGVYLIRFECPGFSVTKRVVLVK